MDNKRIENNDDKAKVDKYIHRGPEKVISIEKDLCMHCIQSIT